MAEPRDDLETLGVLAEPSRRALYDFVVDQHRWVGREQAADAVGLQRGIAAHHLDRLADAGLLEVGYQRLTGRSGPGAGRPAKVYRRADVELEVTLPARDYELASRLLATAADRSRRDGVPIERALDDAARGVGVAIGKQARQGLTSRASVATRRARLIDELTTLGFEPGEAAGGETVLHNCPFHRLAQDHTELVCGMNLCLLDGVLDALGGTGLRAELTPDDDHCCVRFLRTGQANDDPS